MKSRNFVSYWWVVRVEVSEWNMPPQECAKRYFRVEKKRCVPSLIEIKEKLTTARAALIILCTENICLKV